MLPTLLSTILALTPHILSTLSAPSSSLSLIHPRSSPSRPRYCKNSPKTVAGTFFHPRSPSGIPPTTHGTATPQMLWCAPLSQTTILVTIQVYIGDHTLVNNFLSSAYNAVLAEIQHYGDGLVQTGAFTFPGAQPVPGSGATAHSTGAGASTSAAGGQAPLELHAWNENNHQMTWGVLGAAIQALQDCMEKIEEWGTASFSIWDGDNEVGYGVLGHLGGD